MKNSTFSAQVANNLLTLLQGYSKTIRLLLVMFLTLTVSANVWGATYTKVTSTPVDWSGEYIVVYESDNTAYVWTGVDAAKCNTTATISNNSVTGDFVTVTIAPMTNGYSIKVNGGTNSGKYIYGTSGSNKLNFGASAQLNTLSYETDWVKITSNTSVLTFNKASSDMRFRYYKAASYSAQQHIQLYKISSGGGVTPDPCTTPTVAWNTKPANGEVGGSMTASVTTNYSNGLTYSSSNQTVATVNNAGVINYLSAGTTTITATVTGDGTTFCEGPVSVQQEITVTAPAGGDGSDGECSWTLVADASTLKVDDEIIIAASGDNNYALSTNQKSSNRGGTPITKNGNTLTAPSADVQILTLKAGSTSGTFAFYTGTSGYLYAASSTANQLKTKATLDEHGSWTISITDGVASIAATGSSNRNVMQYNYNNGSPLFACYASASQTSLAIYKKICSDDGGDEPTPTQLDKPTNLKVSDVTTTTAALFWDAVANANGYTVVVGSTSHNTNTTSITVENLTASTTYKWSVTAKGNGSTYTDSDAANGSDFTTKTTAPTNYTVTLNPNYPAGKTGVFTDKEGNTVNGNLVISLPEGTKTQPIADLYSSISLNEYIFEGWYEAADGDAHRENTGDISKDITFYAHWRVPYTVYFKAGTGTCTGSITETTANGIQLPTATLEDCGNWVFLGWAENAIASETTTAPASILYGGSTYKPTDDITLYAIYKRVEGGGAGEGTEATLSFADKAQRTYQDGDKQVWEQNDITLTNNKAESTNAVGDYANPARFYKSSEIIISAPGAITKIVAKTSGSDYTTALVNSVEGGGATSDGNTVTITPTASSNTYTIQLTGGQVRLNSITVTYGGGLSTSYYHSNPYCQRCENILTISKGVETNGTFTLDISGEMETCETEVSVVVKPTPANHYHIGSVTATTPTTGGAPTVTDNGNGKYTITYAANSTGTSTINVTFEEDAKATITLYELGVATTITTEYVGDKYTLPSTSSQACGTKTLVGWSTVAFAETDTKPTENYYGISTQITLAETQTFYAVFAQSNGGGGGSGDYERVTAALDNWAGDYLIAYNDQTFANGSTGGKEGMGADGNKVDLSLHITNNTIPASIGDPYNVTLVAIEGGYALQTKDSKYNYQSSNANGLTATDNIETAKKYPLTITFNSESNIAIAHSHGAVFQYNKGDNGYFRFYKDGGQEPVYLYKKSGTAATYTGYTTSCAVITGIEVANPKTEFNQYEEFVFGGTVYAVDENENRIDVTTSATFSGYDMKKAGTDTVIVSYLSFETTYEITINDVDEWQLTWNVSGATTTGLSPAHVIQGNAIGTLPRPKSIPDGCYPKKDFVGWTESNVVNADGSDITFITSETVPSKNTTYYAVFATPSGNAGDGDYVKVTEDANDLSGKYLIVYEEGNLAFNGGLGTLDAASNTISVTITDYTIKSTDATDAAKFTITKNGDAYIITSASNYHIGQTSDANGLLSSKSTSYTNTITITEGNADIIGSGGAYLRYNKVSALDQGQQTGLRFRYYKSGTYTGQQPIALYKKSGSSASYTDYTTGCHDVTITYYGFTGGYTTNCGGSDLNVITQRVNSAHTIPTCTEITDPTTLGRTFLNLWKDQNGKVHQPGESFIVTENITLYAQWKLETTGDIELPADKEDLATTDIVVTGGKTLTIPEGKTITINSLTLKGGLLGANSESGYAMPSVVIPDDATLVRKNTTINLDLVVNNDSWYPFAVPFAIDDNSNIDYLDPVLKAASTYNTHFAIKTYDGANRAIVGTDQENNWDKVKQTAGLQPGKGYIISALTYPDKDTATIRIPMSVSNDWLANGEQTTVNEVTRNQVTVTAYTGDAATEHQRHAGWNFVANPYLAKFAGSNVANDVTYIKGSINIQNEYTYEDTEVTYVTVPAHDFSYYEQFKLSTTKLSPAYSFFVQVGGTGGTMTFETTGRQQAPASIAARNAEERPVKMDVDITLSDNHSSDQTGIIISDRYSDAYEIGRDLEKLFGSAYNLSVYTLMADNTPLAFQALAIRSNMQVIPVGYRAPEQGEYTFRLNEATSSIDLLNEQYEQLVLVDYQTGELTNLLIADYTFYSERTQADNRFALYAVPRQNAPTDLPNAIGQDKQAQKIIHNGHLYILRDGNVYNGNGQIVK